MMGRNRFQSRLWILCLYIVCVKTIFPIHSDARKHIGNLKALDTSGSKIKARKVNALKRFDVAIPVDSSNTEPYGVSSPFSLPPYDSLAPIPLPENTPPFCNNPPATPQPPSTAIPTPLGGYTNPSPPLPPAGLNPPQSPAGAAPSPPITFPTPNPPSVVPSPPEYLPNPPPSNVPSPTGQSPPYYEPSPPTTVPSPFGFTPGPPLFLPPVVYPPPAVPPPPHVAPVQSLWCVAKPSVPDPIIQEAMDYACASGAECDAIQPNGSCFQPNSLLAHASYAFNSYWQRTRVAGGTCEFGGIAILVTVDPSYDGCHFV